MFAICGIHSLVPLFGTDEEMASLWSVLSFRSAVGGLGLLAAVGSWVSVT